MQDLIEAVKAHALANYEADGWDFVIECWEDEEIAEAITEAGATTAEEAIKAVGEVVGAVDEQRRAVQAEAF